MTLALEAEWKLLTDLIEERFGLAFTGVRRDILASRLTPRFKALQCANPLEYYYHLKSHPERDRELGQLAMTLTNNETYFFREAHHFECVARHVIPSLNGELRERPLRILSAGCSSGEEPYSLVMTLQAMGLETHLPHGWEIEACDLNPARLAQARDGAYEETSLRNCDEETRRRYFTRDGNRFLLRDRHRSGVRFFTCNLAAPIMPLGAARYDVILCRNLLIYFGEAAFMALIERFARAIVPGGYLMLGHSESLIDRSPSFRAVVLNGMVVYQRCATER